MSAPLANSTPGDTAEATGINAPPPTGTNPVPALNFPLPSLRQFLMPDQTVKFKIFQASTLFDLDAEVNNWVHVTKAIIAVVGPLNTLGDKVTVALTYVAAAEGTQNG
jgi:hypothetical protein